MTDEEWKKILAENRARTSRYFGLCDPLKGDPKSGVTPREKVTLNGEELWLPTALLQDYPQLRQGRLPELSEMPHDLLCPREKETVPHQRKAVRTPELPHNMSRLLRLRLHYDFEYWCARCVKIQDKLSKRKIPFYLNYGQRKTAQAFEAQRIAGQPIRIIIVKARQWGGSTVTQMYMLWLQLYHYPRWHSAIISQLKNQAINIRSMITQVMQSYPQEVDHYSLCGYEGLQGIRYVPERECKIQISSAETPDALRSFDFAMLHLSEAGLWKSTPSHSAEDLVQALYSTVPDVAGSLIVMESTAKGIGNYFHRTYQAAKSGEGGMTPVFVAWFEIENYARYRHTPDGQQIARDADGNPLSALTDARQKAENFGPYQWEQWKQGATLEGIVWYQETCRSLQYSDFMMKSEYPGTDAEAFQTKSNLYFEPEQIAACRATCRPPLFCGNIGGRSEKGPSALKDLHLCTPHSPSDELRVWIPPAAPEEERPWHNRFVVTVDIGGLGQKADWSIISVFDRKNLTTPNGQLERAATWRGHIDHDLLAWKAAQIATLYNHALLVIESNTLETKDRKEQSGPEGDHFYTVIDEIANEYAPLYERGISPEEIKEGAPRHYGWHTNVRTKYLAYDQCRACLRDHEYEEHDVRCADEMAFLEKKSNGSLGAITGEHDDLIDTTAIALYVSTREMALPVQKVRVHQRENSEGGWAKV